jgi:type I restriction enzyme, S subunit
LYCKTSFSNRIAIEEDLEQIVYSGFLIRFRDGGAIGKNFKQHCFYEEGFRRRLISASSVSANTNINQDNLKQLLIPLPPTRAEQEAIAHTLNDIDALIESLDRLLTKKRQIKQGTMQELLTGKKRLSTFKNKWEEKYLGDIA